MAELVDALVSGTSDESRGGSSPLQGTTLGHFGQRVAIEAVGLVRWGLALLKGLRVGEVSDLHVKLICPNLGRTNPFIGRMSKMAFRHRWEVSHDYCSAIRL